MRDLRFPEREGVRRERVWEEREREREEEVREEPRERGRDIGEGAQLIVGG